VKLLVKLGGTLLDAEESRRSLAAQIAEAWRAGHHIVVVHGGGRQMTQFLAERGVESRFVNGLRVTTPEVLDAVLKVLAGSVNRQLVATLVSQGAIAAGLCGIDGNLTEAEPISSELGFVGRPTRSNPAILNALIEGGFLPVVACVAGDRQGRFFNINADQMAASCAAAFGAERLLFLTDVEGVRDASGATIAALKLVDARELIAAGVASGGMQAKLVAAEIALTTGVPAVQIAPGQQPGVIGRVLAGEALGTRVVL
jgi:acetylglutamate kinase